MCVERKSPHVFFGKEDKVGVVYPHSDAVYLKVKIGIDTVSRVLVNQGSSCDIMYRELFDKLELKVEDLKPTDVTLIGFISEMTKLLGKTVLRLITGTVAVHVEFLVINNNSGHNAIFERPWLHVMHAIPFTYHQKVKFPNVKGEIEVDKGCQVDSIRCDDKTAMMRQHLVIVEQPTSMKKVIKKIIEGEVLIEQKVEEKLSMVMIGEDPENYFFLRKNMKGEEAKEMEQFLISNIDKFAWSPKDMVGLQLKLAFHKLNVRPDAKHVVQKNRRIFPEQRVAIVYEVKRLLEAGAIKEVLYPPFFSKPSGRSKKNGKLRVSIDFKNLNKSFPIDPFPLPRIGKQVDATAGAEKMSFLDAYSGYHQIPLVEEDKKKIAFISP